MTHILRALTIVSFLFVGVMAIWGEATSAVLIVGFTLAGLLGWALSRRVPQWGGLIKWCWVGLSLLVIFAIVSGPLDYLRFTDSSTLAF